MIEKLEYQKEYNAKDQPAGVRPANNEEAHNKINELVEASNRQEKAIIHLGNMIEEGWHIGAKKQVINILEGK